jgi:Homeodomain-like domain
MGRNRKLSEDPDEDLHLRLWEKIVKRGPKACWPWTANDLGSIALGQGSNIALLAKVLVWEETRGPLGKKHRIENTCKTRHCMNPDHMRKILLERRLTPVQRKQALDLLAEGFTQAEVAARFNVTQPAISYIKNKFTKNISLE